MSRNVTFRKSRHSDMQSGCIELGRDDHLVRVRDSKAPDAGTLGFSIAEIRRFFAEIRTR
ncbi:DUF397 domain-containing protein [Actinomadura sp. WMMA1423]|uniref:DUF397 domain-containing protein n=1 Tax=Actinomadura sp. WMMA1423 TaxID=2591108 RepID=UPI001F0DFC06|nr:DUF397 domain-containing protein [Actinomadura sp. WMMA1423]